MKRYIIIVMLVALLAAAGAALAQDENDIEVLQSGEPVAGVLYDNVTAVLYGFNASEGDRVTLTMVQDAESDLNPYLVVLGPAGQLIAADDDSGPVEQSAMIEATIPNDGSYFVLASSFEAIDGIQAETVEAEQFFTVTLEGNNPPSGMGDTLTYYRNELVYDIPTEGYSSADEPVYYFVFNGEAGDVLDITVVSTDIDPLVFLFDSEGNRLAVNDDAETMDLPDITDAAIEFFELPEDGLYFVFATDVYFYQVDEDYRGGNFVITLDE